jgi:hypothetical protein
MLRMASQGVRRRPPLYRPKERAAVLIGLIAVGYITDGWWWASLGALVLLYLTTTWVLAPYSKFAWRVHQPPLERVERWRRLADKLTHLPIIGPVFRFANKISHDAGQRAGEDYERWLRQQSPPPEIVGRNGGLYLAPGRPQVPISVGWSARRGLAMMMAWESLRT